MAIRYVDHSKDEPPRKPAASAEPAAAAETARADGEARFATPMDAAALVNPDASGELPFTDLPPSEKGGRKKRSVRPATRK